MPAVPSNNLDSSIAGDPTGATDSAAAIVARAGLSGTLVSKGISTAKLATAGVYKATSTIDLHPSVSLDMMSRGSVIIVPDNNLSGTTSNYAGQSYGAGAPNSVIRAARAVAPYTSTDAVSAFYQKIKGINIDFKGTTQSNTVHGIRYPNPKTSNVYDGDANYSGNQKQYTVGTIEEIEVLYASGTGILCEAGNDRAHISSARALWCGGDGILLNGNDVVIDGHCGFGSNLGFGLHAGNAGGMLGVTINLWGNPATRSVTCGAALLYGRNNFSFTSCILNDWLRIDGAGSPYSGGSWSHSVWSPFASSFVSDGVAADYTVGGPDPRLQSNIGVTDMQGVTFYGNSHMRTNPTNTGSNSFATPYNAGGAGGVGTLGYAVGDLTGAWGTAPAYLYTLQGAGQAAIIEHVCSAPNVKPWCNTNPATASYNDPVPYRVLDSAQVAYLMQDSYLGLTRIGARGIHSHLMLGAYEKAFPSLVYSVEIGDSNSPGGVPYRNGAYGMWEFQQPVQYMPSAWHYGAVANSGTFNYAPATPLEFVDLNLQGNTYTAGTITWPGGLNASQFVKFTLRNGTCPNITWGTTTNSIDQTLATLPTSIDSSAVAGYYLEFWYDAGNDKLRVLKVTTAPVSDIVAKVPAGSAVALNSGIITNIISIALNPGTWNVTAGVQFTASSTNSPTPTQCGCVIGTASNSYVQTDSTTYSASQVNLGAVAVNVDFLKLGIGPARFVVATGTTTTIYLNAKCVYTGTTGATTAWGFLRATPAN